MHWAIKDAVNASGEAYLSSTVLGGRRVLRMAVMNPRTTANGIVGVLEVVERVARRVK